MDKHEYQKLCDRLVPHAALIDRTIREAERMMNRKTGGRAVRRTAGIAFAVFLAVAGVAFAATFHAQILDAIFRKGEPSQAVREALQTDVARTARDGLTLNIDEFLMDGNSLSCKWTVTSSRADDVYYLTHYDLDDGGASEDQPVGGAYGGSSSNDVGDMTLVRLTPEANSYSGDFRTIYESAPDAVPEMTLRIYAFTTALSPVEIENAFDLIHADEGDALVRDLEAKGEIAYDSAQLSSVWAYSSVRRAHKALLADGADDEAAEVGALCASGLMKKLTTLELRFVPGPDAADARFSLETPRTVRLPDRTVILNQLNLDVASTTIQYDIYPDALPTERNLLNGYRYLLFDQDGNLLDVDYALGLGINTNMEFDDAVGAWRLAEGEDAPQITVSVSGNPLPEEVTAIRFVPTGFLKREEGESSNAYYGRMAALADEADTFVIAFK